MSKVIVAVAATLLVSACIAVPVPGYRGHNDRQVYDNPGHDGYYRDRDGHHRDRNGRYRHSDGHYYDRPR